MKRAKFFAIIFNNGEKVLNVADWEKRKKEIYDLVVTFQYGNFPPEPEILEIEYSVSPIFTMCVFCGGGIR